MVPVCACYSPKMFMFHVSVSDVSMAVFGGTPANAAETSSCVEKHVMCVVSPCLTR